MSGLSKRRWSLILFCLALLIAGGGLASLVHTFSTFNAAPAAVSTPGLAWTTPTPLPTCVQLPQQIDWQHLSAQDLARYGLPNPPTSLTDLSQWILLMQGLKHRSCTITIPPLKKIHSATQVATTQQQQGCPTDRNCQNPTWAGGIADQFPYREVEATWNLPCVSQDVKDSSSSAWVGLGGVESSAALVQAGIDNEVDAQGQVQYEAWAEAYTPGSATSTFHDSQVDFGFAQGLHCGDMMYVQVSSDVGGKIDPAYPDTYFIGDMTTGEYEYYNPSSWQASDGSTAEWIVEQPTFMTGETLSLKPLTHFGTLDFTFCLAYAEKQGFLTTNALPLQLVSMKGSNLPLAIPSEGPLSSIVVQWMRGT